VDSRKCRAAGRTPLWAPNGRELFYLDGDGRLTTVPVRTSPTFNYGNSTTLFDTRTFTVNVRSYDVSRDGQKFLMIKEPLNVDPKPAPAARLVVVLNWTEELKRLVPTR
jgi:hypothetical protein